MKTVFHSAASRGQANHGWLKSAHTFSFANYYKPDRMHFGALRVLNDDQVLGGQGFGTHPHANMEIISIPLLGDLAHKDSMGNGTIIKAGDIQVMSAGTGIQHSEYNANPEIPVHFLQIWMFPNQENVQPRYDQITLNPKQMDNQLHQILSPNSDDEGVWVHQNAWFHMGDFSEEKAFSYSLKDKSNGVYIFVLEGELFANEQKLERRDGVGIWETDQIAFKTMSASKVLLMEVPMIN